MGSHRARGRSMTRRSERNSRRYRRTAEVVGASGVPSWRRMTPTRGDVAIPGPSLCGAPGAGKTPDKTVTLPKTPGTYDRPVPLAILHREPGTDPIRADQAVWRTCL